MSLGKHDPPQPGPGLRNSKPIRLVVAHAEHDVAHVGADGFAQVGDGVDERDLGGEERVGGVLDGLGRCRVGDDDRRLDLAEQRGDADGRSLVLGADHDAIGVEAVVDGRALAEELGVGHDGHVATGKRPLDDEGRANRHRRLVDDDRLRSEHRAKVAGRVFDVAEVGRAILTLGGGHAQEDELGVGLGHRRRLAEHEGETASVDARLHQLLQAVLQNRHDPLL